jgi:hypothetical protein
LGLFAAYHVLTEFSREKKSKKGLLWDKSMSLPVARGLPFAQTSADRLGLQSSSAQSSNIMTSPAMGSGSGRKLMMGSIASSSMSGLAPSTPFTSMTSFTGASNTPMSTASSRLSVSHFGGSSSDNVVSQQMVGIPACTRVSNQHYDPSELCRTYMFLFLDGFTSSPSAKHSESKFCPKTL